MAAVSLPVCLLGLLRRNGESSCCCCPSASGRLELMHYLKPPPSLSLSASLSPPIHSESQKAKGHRHNGDKEVLHPPGSQTLPHQNTHTLTQANKCRVRPPSLTYHRRTSQQTHKHAHPSAFFEFLPMYLAARLSLPPTAPHCTISLSLPDLIMAPPG